MSEVIQFHPRRTTPEPPAEDSLPDKSQYPNNVPVNFPYEDFPPDMFNGHPTDCLADCLAADIQFGIRWNDTSMGHEPCAFCGKPGRATGGPELLVQADWLRVCHACGETFSNWIVAKLKELQQLNLDERILP